MSIQKEPSGRRSVQVEVEVVGTPEQVWAAIATGPGISAWFVPTKLDGRVGGKLSLDFGGGMESGATITEWQPPHRFVAQDTTWLQGGPPVATEWSVEARKGGKCVVRVVHSLFASTDDWDGQLGSVEGGWPSYFRVLRRYLEHHAGEVSASFALMAPVSGGAGETWDKFARALGIPASKVGQAVRVDLPGAGTLGGSVLAVDDLPQGKGVMIAAATPAPGVVLASSMDCMGMRLASLQAFFYGSRAAAAAAQKEQWQAWLVGLFPPPADAPVTS